MEIQPPVPAAGTFRQEAPQVDSECFAAVQNDILNMISQPEPEETSVEPPPIQDPEFCLDPAILGRINSYGSISISRAGLSSQVPKETARKTNSTQPTVPNNVVSPPLQGREKLNSIIDKYKHLWAY